MAYHPEEVNAGASTSALEAVGMLPQDKNMPNELEAYIQQATVVWTTMPCNQSCSKQTCLKMLQFEQEATKDHLNAEIKVIDVPVTVFTPRREGLEYPQLTSVDVAGRVLASDRERRVFGGNGLDRCDRNVLRFAKSNVHQLFFDDCNRDSPSS